MGSTKMAKFSTCHPDRVHFSKGMCKKCYDVHYYSLHKEKLNKRSKNWAKANPEKIRKTGWKYRYGLSESEIADMWEKQNKQCKICFKEVESFEIDHCHTTDKVRGLLCGPCNRGLGCFYDSTEALVNAIKYLTNE